MRDAIRRSHKRLMEQADVTLAKGICRQKINVGFGGKMAQWIACASPPAMDQGCPDEGRTHRPCAGDVGTLDRAAGWLDHPSSVTPLLA